MSSVVLNPRAVVDSPFLPCPPGTMRDSQGVCRQVVHGSQSVPGGGALGPGVTGGGGSIDNGMFSGNNRPSGTHHAYPAGVSETVGTASGNQGLSSQQGVLFGPPNGAGPGRPGLTLQNGILNRVPSWP